MHVREEDIVEQGIRSDLASGRERLLDLGDGSTDQHEIASRLDGSGPDQIDLGALHHRIGCLDSDRYTAEVDEREGGLDQRV